MAGKRVVNTRAVHQAGELDALLRDRGATPLSYPCIAIEPVVDSAELDRALIDLGAGEFDWLALTSANTVHALAQWLAAPGRGLFAVEGGGLLVEGINPSTFHPPPSTRLAVVGPGTAEAALRELGLRADVMPPTYRAVDLAAAIPIEPGQRVLIPQSEIASPDLANALTAKGALVTTVTAYRTVVGSGGVDLPALLARGEVDAVIFASSSAVEGCAERLSVEGEGLRGQGSGVSFQSRKTRDQRRETSLNPLPSTLDRVTTVCIGPGTARTAFAHGLLAPIIPVEQTLAGSLDALEMEFAALSKGLVS